MVRVFSLGDEVRINKYGDIYGDLVIPFNCKQCGYIELYNGKYMKQQKNRDR